MDKRDASCGEQHTQDTIAQQLMRTFMRLKRADWRSPVSIEGCKPSEVRVLFCIKRSVRPDAPLKVSEISKLLHVTSPTVTQLLNGLEANGLVQRTVDASDRRAVSIKLTEKGERITQIAAERLLASFNGLADHLGEERSRQLNDLLIRAFHYFDEARSSEPN